MEQFTELVNSLYNDTFLLYVAVMFLVFCLLEMSRPFLRTDVPFLRRWYINLCLYISYSLLAYFALLHLFGTNLEVAATNLNIGLFSVLTGLPWWVEFAIFLLVIDLSDYVIHRIMHNWRPLWRFHIVHHSDTNIDVSTSFRQHPIEVLIAIFLRLGIAVALGVPLFFMILYDVLYTLFVYFPHANVRLPRRLEQILRLVIVTPDFHRSHHSADIIQTNTNYGDIFSFWDRLFGTYHFYELEQQKDMKLGLEYFNRPEDQTVLKTLLQPFTYTPEMRKQQNTTMPLQEQTEQT